MTERLWHYLTAASEYAAGLLVLFGGCALIIFGVPIIAEFVMGILE